jgi:hypothetical protein
MQKFNKRDGRTKEQKLSLIGKMYASGIKTAYGISREVDMNYRTVRTYMAELGLEDIGRVNETVGLYINMQDLMQPDQEPIDIYAISIYDAIKQINNLERPQLRYSRTHLTKLLKDALQAYNDNPDQDFHIIYEAKEYEVDENKYAQMRLKQKTPRHISYFDRPKKVVYHSQVILRWILDPETVEAEKEARKK